MSKDDQNYQKAVRKRLADWKATRYCYCGCGEEIVGRANKKFVNQDHKNNFHNAKRSIVNEETRLFKKQIDRNYCLCKEYCSNESGYAEVQLAELIQKGFNVQVYMTIERDKITGLDLYTVGNFCFALKSVEYIVIYNMEKRRRQRNGDN